MKNRHKAYTRILLSGLMVIFLTSCGGKNKGLTKEVESRKQNIVETGELAAVETRSFVMPRFGRWWYEMKITGMVEHGTEVKAGDSIIQLDPSNIQKYIIDREGDLETQKATLEKMIVNMSNRASELATNLENENAAFDLKKLEVESSRFESEKIRQVKALEFEQAKIQLEKTRKQIELNLKIQNANLKIQKLRVEGLRKDIKNAYEILPKLTIRTPISGIFQIGKNRRNNSLIKIGDEVYAGNNMGNVPDLTWMKVNTTVNEHDFMKIYLDQDVRIRMDAMPEFEFMGKVNFISKLCYLKDQKSKQKIFDIEIKVNKSDLRLKPGMTVSCEFLNPKKQ